MSVPTGKFVIWRIGSLLSHYTSSPRSALRFGYLLLRIGHPLNAAESRLSIYKLWPPLLCGMASSDSEQPGNIPVLTFSPTKLSTSRIHERSVASHMRLERFPNDCLAPRVSSSIESSLQTGTLQAR